jgi:dephospho-CoA kinase
MKIIVIIGMPASGKDNARKYAEAKLYPYISTGDIIRAEVKKRGLAGNPDNMAKLSEELRGKDGIGVTQIVLSVALDKNADLVFLEGMRSWKEIELIKNNSECLILAIIAPRAIRLARVQQRGREDDSVEYFAKRDWREINYGLAACIALADDYVLNTGTIEEAFISIDEIVKKHISKSA